MRISRVYLPLETSTMGTSVNIEGDKAHYIKNVLRLKVGFTLHFFTPNGNQYQFQNYYQVGIHILFIIQI